MATYPLATLAPEITAAGISAKSYDDIYQSLIASVQLIYGTDFYLDPDSQDGQLLAVFARALYDVGQACVATYNAFSPLTAQGVGLSSVVKINGIRRNIASNSQVNVTVTGTVGLVINKGVVQDTAGNLWNLPPQVIIPLAGFIIVTATAQEAGAISAAAGTVNTIYTPTLGWASVTNASAASVGQPVETDAELRQRQAVSVALPSLSILEGLAGAIESITGVSELAAYENDTKVTDANGLPPHSISMVVLGGDATAIATAIADKKGPGCSTYGTTTIAITDQVGTRNINFYVPTPKTITVVVTLHPITSGYTSSVGDQIKQAVVDYINNQLGIGDDVYRDRLFLPAQLYGAQASKSFNVTNIQIAIAPGAVGTSDLVIAFNENAVCTLADVTLTIV